MAFVEVLGFWGASVVMALLLVGNGMAFPFLDDAAVELVLFVLYVNVSGGP